MTNKKPRKTYTIRNVYKNNVTVSLTLVRYGKILSAWPVKTEGDHVTGCDLLRRVAIELGATHIRLESTGTVEAV